MSPQRAAAILSLHSHRGASLWWVSTRQEYANGHPHKASIVVASRTQEFSVFEAYAIAQNYLAVAEQPTTVQR